MLKKFRAKRNKPPEPIPPPKPPRPSISKLRNIYRDLISADVDQRVETLKKVAHWYEHALAYVVYFKAWTPKQKEHLADADGHRLTALRSNEDETIERALIESIRCYEKLVRKLSPPKINSFLSKYSKVRSILVKRRRRFNYKFDDFLETVDVALKPCNYDGIRINLHVDKLSHSYRINSKGDMTFDRKFLDNARRTSRKHGLLVGLVQGEVISVLSKSAAMTVERDYDGHRTGRYHIHGSKRAKAWEEMLNNLIQYCLTSKTHVRLIRRHKDAASVKTAA